MPPLQAYGACFSLVLCYFLSGGTMINVNHIIEDFRNADPAQRLSLYLAHRDLRPFFDNIESEELINPDKIRITVNMIAKENEMIKSTTPFKRALRWCYSLLS